MSRPPRARPERSATSGPPRGSGGADDRAEGGVRTSSDRAIEWSTSPRPVVYLDSQDFSRFGDVLRGRSDEATTRIFLDLEARGRAGEAVFPVSMPLLSELLQYDPAHRETTMRKAEAIGRLCGPWALAFPTRLVAAEVAAAVAEAERTPMPAAPEVLSSERYWFPDVSDVLAGMRGRMRSAVEAEIATLDLPTRFMRRKAKRLARGMDPVAAAREAAPELADRYGLPVEAVTGSFVELLRGRIDAATASRRLFSAIAEPVAFVETYFERVETDRSLLPGWISGLGAGLQARFEELRDRMAPLAGHPEARQLVEAMLVEWPERLGATVVGMAADDLRQFGREPGELPALLAREGFLDDVPAARIVGRLIAAYARQTHGISAAAAKVERSFGGDLMHALYLPHVDLWRGDRRFAALVASALPAWAPRVVPLLRDLPAAIDAWRPAAPARVNPSVGRQV